MKKIIFYMALIPIVSFGQQQTTGTPIGNVNYNDWYRGGNNGNNLSPNIFGSSGTWNSPIYTQTYGVNRTKLNGTFGIAGATQYGIDLYTTFGNTNTTVNTSGYMLLGPNAPFQVGGGNIYDNKGAYSLLHLNGTSPIQQNGYRPWMKTGITFTDNQDMSYFGLRQIGTSLDYTETVLNWSDNQTIGADEMTFRFTGASTNSTTINTTNLRDNTDLDGLHIARYTATGLYGLGNTFGHVGAPGHASIYVSPKSLLHMSYDRQSGFTNEAFGFMQITYRDQLNPGIIGIGETELDGLRFGIDNDFYSYGGIQHLSGFLRWQENSAFIIQSDWDNIAGGIQNGERMIISSINAPGIPNPLGLNTNTTRVAISYSGGFPLSQPRALLHLGSNNSTLNVANWMDYGTLTTNTTQSVFTGITPTGYSDANQSVIGYGGANLVFIEANDMEVARFDRNSNNFGIGNFSPTGAISSAPTERLDVEGNGRFRDVPEQGGQSIILGLQQGANPNDIELSRLKFPNDPSLTLLGNGTWGNATGGIVGPQGPAGPTGATGATGAQGPAGLTIGAHNGTSMSLLDPTKVAFGNDLGLTNGQLLNDREVPMNNHNIVFTDNNAIASNGENRIGVGTSTPNARMHIKTNDVLQESAPIALIVDNNQTTSNGFAQAVNVNMNGQNILNTGQINTISGANVNTGLDAITFGGIDNNGLIGRATDGLISNHAIVGEAISNNIMTFNNTAVQGTSRYGRINYGGFFEGGGNPNLGTNSNFGVYSRALGSGVNNYGVYTEIGVNPNSAASNNTALRSISPNLPGYLAGDFTGTVNVNGMIVLTSDFNLKENINSLNNADSILNQLNPVSFTYKQTGIYDRMDMATGNQFGLIAQEVEIILPELVKNVTFPAEYDSLGIELAASINYKTLNYDALIPILIKGHQEQNTKIDSLMLVNNTITNSNDSLVLIVSNLNDRLTQLENCLSGILPYLCQMNNSSIQPTQEIVQEQLRAAIKVNLSDRNAIVLNQNVPNPFAESTIITFSIPTTVQKAQIHFYDGTGKLINSVDIVERGNGQLNVFANDLSTGVYTYSLVADGQVVSTKRMMKQ